MEDKIAAFVLKKRAIREISLNSTENKKEEKPTPWYMRPLSADEFTIKRGKDENYYLQHKEWSKRTYVGPYYTRFMAEDIVKRYVKESLKGPLHMKPSNDIHSILIENENFFTASFTAT